jgi:hypothetical protein
MRLLVLAVLAMSVISIVSCSKKSTDTGDILTAEDLLVDNNEITGWTYTGQRWTANSYSELTVYINGQADTYERHGFQEAAHQDYAGTIDSGTRTLKLSVFDQGTAENAKATFDDPDTGVTAATIWTDGAGEEAKYRRFNQLSQLLSFYSGRYFVLLEMNFDTEESLSILKQFALNVDGKIN